MNFSDLALRKPKAGRRHGVLEIEFALMKHINIIHSDEGDDSEFVLLGTRFDCCLTMEPCIAHLLNKLRPKVRAMLSLKSMYSVRSLLNQFKTQIWSSMEFHNGALLIAREVQLRKLDKMQRGMIWDLMIEMLSTIIILRHPH